MSVLELGDLIMIALEEKRTQLYMTAWAISRLSQAMMNMADRRK